MPEVLGGFGWCNPAYMDGSGAMTTEEYIATCPENWQPILRVMAEVMDQAYPGNWKIRQIKTKFGEARVYLAALEPPAEGSDWRVAMSAMESITEDALDYIIQRDGEPE